MKRMIISPAQLKAINEAAALTYAKSASPADVTAAVNGMIGKTNSNEFQVKVPGNNGPAMATTLPDLQKGTETISPETSQINVTADPTKSNTGTALGESRYSKRQVELGRMLEMRRTGKVYSKKQLNEMFMETQDNVNRLDAGLGNCLIFKIFDAVATVFGSEVEEEMKGRISNGEDPMMTIKDIFSREESEKQEEFLNTLGI